MFDVSTLELSQPDNKVVSLTDYAGKPLLIQLLRYWG